MSATAIHSFRKPAWEVTVLPTESRALEPLLDLAVLQANAREAYVYRFDRATGRGAIAAFAGPAPAGKIPSGNSGLRGATAALHWNRTAPVVLHANAAEDWRFAGFPEFQDRKFDGVVSVPLVDSGEVVGIANFCRPGGAPLSAGALNFLMSLSLPLGALLAASSLREQLRQVAQDLADRKLVERAKGLLQARFLWTEEEAYLQLRRLSRRRRTPMREIAQLVVEAGLDHLSEAWPDR